MSWKIREAALSDAKGMAETHIESWRAAYAGVIQQALLDGLNLDWGIPRAIKRISTPELVNLVGVSHPENQVVGFATGGACRNETLPYHWELYAIYLRPSWWGQGMGKELFHELAKRICRPPDPSMSVAVLEKNHLARKFYERMGGILLSQKGAVTLGGQNYPEVTYGWKDPRNS